MLWIMIAGTAVGDGHPPYVVAELSGNHLGRLERSVELIRAAAAAGAAAVKFQTFTADSMTLDLDSDVFVIHEPLWEGRRMHELFAEVAMPMEWYEPLIRAARESGLTWFSSAFDVAAVEFLDGLDVPALKIASSELVDLDLIAAAAATGRPLLVSTGMATEAEIDEAVTAARDAGCRELLLLRCTASYPAPEDELDLATIPLMRERWGCPVGFSDHTLGPTAAVTAVALGASLVEKHLTLQRSDGGPDADFSAEPAELTALVSEVRSAYRSTGKARFGPSPSELPTVEGRRSLFAVRDIAAGEVFTRDNVWSIRPGAGLPPRELAVLLDRRAASAIRRGTPLSWELVEP